MLTPTEHVRIKEECRKKGVEVYSIFSYNTENIRESSTVKDIIFVSNLKVDEVLQIAIHYFQRIGYIGKVQVCHVQGTTYRAVLSKRLKY